MLALACAFILSPQTTANADAEETHDHSTMTNLKGFTGIGIIGGEWYLGEDTNGDIIIEEDGEVTTQPTCTDEGVKTFTCTLCNTTKTESVDALGHTLAHHEATAATEDKDGNSEYWSCDVCGNYFSDETGETIISDKSSVTLPKLTPENNGGLSAGAIAGIVIGIIIFLIIVEYFVCYFVLYRKGIIRGKFFDVIYVPMNAICGKKEQDNETEIHNTDE